MWIRSRKLPLLGRCGPVTTLSVTGLSSSFMALDLFPPPPAALGLNNQKKKKKFALSFELRLCFLEAVGQGSLPCS